MKARRVPVDIPDAVSAVPDRAAIGRMLTPLIVQEIVGISGLEAAIAAEASPGYVVLFQDSKANKQANVEQMTTLLRMAGAVPSETATLRQFVEKTRTRVAEAVGGTVAALQTLRAGAGEMLPRYRDVLGRSQGLMRNAIEKAQGRTIVFLYTLTAHIARLTSDGREAAHLPYPLAEYFAGSDAKVCMRCHFDRPGVRPPLERKGKHPYTYICAACHDDVVHELTPDLAAQMLRWTERAREARAIQHALGRPSKLMAAHTVIRRLAGLSESLPQLPPKKPLEPPMPSASPSNTARRGVVHAESSHPGEAEYIASLFDPDTVRRHW